MSGPLHAPQKPCGLAQAPHLSVPCSVICRIIYCTRSPQELAPFPLRTQTSIQVRMPTLCDHRASMNSSYRISCCLSFRGRRLWYLNYCLHWQEANISAESGRIHRSTNKKKKSLTFWRTSCPINLTHSQIMEFIFSKEPLSHFQAAPSSFPSAFLWKRKRRRKKKTRESQRNY